LVLETDWFVELINPFFQAIGPAERRADAAVRRLQGLLTQVNVEPESSPEGG
jgi:hypothetical protein